MSEAAISVARAIDRITNGEAQAADELLPLVYDELRRLAAAKLKRLPPGQTLEPTALVHDAFVELVKKGDPGWNGRRHFFGAAARAMHDILVDQARRKASQKRGGDGKRATLEESHLESPHQSSPEELLSLSRSLERLQKSHPRQAEVAMLKTFAGLTEQEIAELNDVTVRTVERDWRFAQAFLSRELER